MENSKNILLVIDDDIQICNLIKKIFYSEEFRVETISNSRNSIEFFNKIKPDVVLLDIVMPEINGIDILLQIKKIDKDVIVIMLTGKSDMDSVIDAIKSGAYDYIVKPFNIEELKTQVKKAMDIRNIIKNEKYILNTDIYNEKTSLPEIIGTSEEMIKIYKIIGKITNTRTTCIIYGESGTGKELIARAIHYSGIFRDKPFVTVDCSLIPANLMESELFGHEKGAFTDAIQSKEGKFEIADTGTIFLDEISNLSHELQAKLLRVIQEKKIERLGATKEKEINVRIITATNKDLKEEVKKGNFREDLFYRLNVVPIYVPPLRERKKDIPLLIEHFINKYSSKKGSISERISNEALQLLCEYHWPGNVRELENTIQKIIIFNSNKFITVDDLPEEIKNPEKNENIILKELINKLFEGKIKMDELFENIEKEIIITALKKTNGHHILSAKLLGITRQLLEYKIKKYKITF